ncbi:hypothetical protein ACLQ25_11670 [Micromonospora sp. DT44]
MAEGLLAAARLTFTPVQRMGRFTLARFLPAFDPDIIVVHRRRTCAANG